MNRNVLVKICGLTRAVDIQAVAQAGGDAVGLNFVPGTPRCLDDLKAATALSNLALKEKLLRVGVFVNAEEPFIADRISKVGLDVVQLHGDEDEDFASQIQEKFKLKIWKVYRVATKEDLETIEKENFPCEAILLDARVKGAWGGTGETLDWSMVSKLKTKKPLILAGGLKPENVATAIKIVQPNWVDTASGVENSHGIKDAQKIEAFVQASKR